MSSTDIKNMIEKASTNPDAPHLAKAIQGVKLFQRQSNAELEQLMQAIGLEQNAENALSIEEVTPLVAARLSTDAVLVEKMNPMISAAAGATFPLKTNKLNLILKWTQTAFHQEAEFKNFVALWDGAPPEHYAFDTEALPIMDWDAKTYMETATIWGSSKGDVLKTELFNILLAQTRKTRIADLDLAIKFNHWEAADSCISASNWTGPSALFHSTPYPETLTYQGFCQADERFKLFPYFVFDTQQKLRLGFPHCGYTFGGQREDQAPEKPYPQDCSSIVSQWTGCSITYSTADQLAFYRWKDASKACGGVNQDWLTGREAQSMQDCYDVVTVRDPQKDIRPGQIWAVRRFKDTDSVETMNDPKQYGSGGGHTTLVLGFDSKDKKIHTLSCNRSYPSPEMNGIGVQSFDYPPVSHHKVMLFSVKAKAAGVTETSNVKSTSFSEASVDAVNSKITIYNR